MKETEKNYFKFLIGNFVCLNFDLLFLQSSLQYAGVDINIVA